MAKTISDVLDAVRVKLEEIVATAPARRPDEEDYDDMESAYRNGLDVAAWEAAVMARAALRLLEYQRNAARAHDVADAAASFNPRFDRERFLKACGL